MSSNITGLLGGGTTETITNSSGGPTILPSTDVINLTDQIIAINDNPNLTPDQKAAQIQALQGISYNAVNTNPTVNIQGVGQITNTATPQSTIDSVLQNLYSQIGMAYNAATGQATTITPTVTQPDLFPTTVTNPMQNSLSPVSTPPSSNTSITFSSIGQFFQQHGLLIMIGLIILLIILHQRPSQKISYVKPQVLEAMR